MDLHSSFRATILFGWSTLVLLFVAGFQVGRPEVSALAVVAMSLAYLCQWLVTQGMVIAERAYGPDVTSDDDGTYDRLLALSSRFHRAAFAVNMIAAFVGVVDLGLLTMALR